MDRIKELEQLITRHQHVYYNKDVAEIPDADFDALVDELRVLNPASDALKKIGAKPTSGWALVKHGAPMGSQLKVNTFEELEQWARSSDIQEFSVSDKLDGWSLSIAYDNGTFVQGVTRGDGFEGEDITRNIRNVPGVPTSITSPIIGRTYVRGEIIMPKATFETKYAKDAANPRAAAALVRRHSGEGCEDLAFIAYDVEFPVNGLLVTNQDKFRFLDANGFRTPAYSTGDLQAVKKLYEDYVRERRDVCAFELDGLIVRANSLELEHKLGIVDNRPKGQRAFKFPSVERETVLLSVVWQTGRTGKITPVGELSPVSIGGVTVTRATLNNLVQIRERNIGIGGKILLRRANDVIPEIVSGSGGDEICMPSMCPSCQGSTEFDGVHVMCYNPTCPAQAQEQLLFFLDVLKVKGFGPALISRLHAAKILNSPVDFFKLTPGDIGDLEGFSEKVGVKLMTEFMKKANQVTLPQFVKMLSIPGIGEHVTELLQDRYPTIEALCKGTAAEFATTHGVGLETAMKLERGLHLRQAFIDALLMHLVVTNEKPTIQLKGNLCKGWTVVETGFREPGLMMKVIEQGGECAKSMNKKVTHLVALDTHSGSDKIKKAKAAGVAILSKAELERMLHNLDP